MKYTCLRIVIIFISIINIVQCKAQQTFPLHTSTSDIPNLAYLKDTNNELQPFVGTYFSTYNGNKISLYITKQEKVYFDFGSKKLYRDILSMRFIIKNSTDIILQDTQNMIFQPNQEIHTIYSKWVVDGGTKVLFNYDGTNCGIGWGKIDFKKINNTQYSWEYSPNSSLIDAATCPPSTDKTIYLPETKDLIFTKQ